MIGLTVSLFSILVSFFVYWKKLREDYPAQVIFSSAFIVLMAGMAGLLASDFWVKEWFFWLIFGGTLLGFAFSVLRYKMKFYETLDALILSLVPFMALFFLRDSVINTELSSFLAFLVMLALGLSYYFLDLNYKGFVWYRSGRVGFSGLCTSGLFFLIRAGVAIFNSNVLSFVGKGEVYLSGFVAVTCFLLVWKLGNIMK